MNKDELIIEDKLSAENEAQLLAMHKNSYVLTFSEGIK